MELWVRSQDRTKLVKSNYLSLFLSDTNWFIYTDTETGEPFSIGKYKTEERALEVLDEIEERICMLQTIELTKGNEIMIKAYNNAMGEDKMKGLGYPYQMPME